MTGTIMVLMGCLLELRHPYGIMIAYKDSDTQHGPRRLG